MEQTQLPQLKQKRKKDNTEILSSATGRQTGFKEEAKSWGRLKRQVTDIGKIRQNCYWKEQSEKELFNTDPYQVTTYSIMSKLTSSATFAFDVFKQTFFEAKPSYTAVKNNILKRSQHFQMKCLFIQQKMIEKLSFNKIYIKSKNQLKLQNQTPINGKSSIILGITANKNWGLYQFVLLDYFIKSGDQNKNRQICRIIDMWVKQNWHEQKYLYVMMTFCSLSKEITYFFTFRTMSPVYSIRAEKNLEFTFNILANIEGNSQALVEINSKLEINPSSRLKFAYFTQYAKIQFNFQDQRCYLNVIYQQFQDRPFKCVMKKGEIMTLEIGIILQNILQMKKYIEKLQQRSYIILKDFTKIIWIPPIMLAADVQLKDPLLRGTYQKLLFCEKGFYLACNGAFSNDHIIWNTYPKLCPIVCPTLSITDQFLSHQVPFIKMHIEFFSLLHKEIRTIQPSTLSIISSPTQIVYTLRQLEDPLFKYHVKKSKFFLRQIIEKRPIAIKITINIIFNVVKFESYLNNGRRLMHIPDEYHKKEWLDYQNRRLQIEQEATAFLEYEYLIRNILHLTQSLKKDPSRENREEASTIPQSRGTFHERLQRLRMKLQQS